MLTHTYSAGDPQSGGNSICTINLQYRVYANLSRDPANYRLQGFTDAKVGTPVVNTQAAGTMTVDFPITEGPQTILTAVTVEGNEQVPSKGLPALQLHSGEPLNPQLERADVVALQSYYADRGNAEVQVKTREDVSQDKTTAKLTYVLAEGPKMKIGDIAVTGSLRTRRSDGNEADMHSCRFQVETTTIMNR